MKSEIEKYLTQKGIAFRVNGNEIITKCFFSPECDSDSRGSEAHLYFSTETGQYDCKKCPAKGNFITLKKHFGDTEDQPKRNVKTLNPKIVEKCHQNLTQEIVDYLHSRGISDEVIKSQKLGYWSFYGKWWITIPILDVDGNYNFFKLRQDPKHGDEKITWPQGAKAQVYDWNTLLFAKDKIVICEGEMDALLLKSRSIPCITGTHGAKTAKEDWAEYFKKDIAYYICYDNDNAGKTGALKIADVLLRHGCQNIFIIDLPELVGEGGDLGDYLVRLGLPLEDLFTKYAKQYPEKIDVSKFREITIEEVCKILDSTIKKDDVNKAITFLSMLNTYTDESQMNVFFNAPSSTGKSHIPLAIIVLFPQEDVIILAYCSPTAFFHEQGVYDKETNIMRVDLSRKIICFTDMPDTGLIARLRPILSHDQKESSLKITDKNQKGGNKTKTVIINGYPSVYFCSTGLRVDEQESTRFIMLSPSIEHDKILQGIKQVISKESDQDRFGHIVKNDPDRNLLIERIRAIKQEKISDIKIKNTKLIEEIYLKDHGAVKPRQQRDIKKIVYLIKAFALLNLWFREREGNYIWANDKDIMDAFALWDQISAGQDYGLAPYIFEIYTKIILPLWNEPSEEYGDFKDSTDKKTFITRKEVLIKHFDVFGWRLSMTYLRQHILPQLEQAGLITQQKSPDDGREMVVIPLETDL